MFQWIFHFFLFFVICRLILLNFYRTFTICWRNCQHLVYILITDMCRNTFWQNHLSTRRAGKNPDTWKKRAVWSDPRRRTFSRVFKAQHPSSSVWLLPWCRAVQWWRQLRIRSSRRLRLCSQSGTDDPEGVVCCWYRHTLHGLFSPSSRQIYGSAICIT